MRFFKRNQTSEADSAAQVSGARADEHALVSLLPRIRSWVFGYVGPRPDVEDLVQEALVEVAAALDRFEGRAQFSTFAHRIVIRTVAREVQRRRARERVTTHSDIVELAAVGTDSEREVMERQELRRLYTALDTLSEDKRRAFVLCVVDKLSFEEAAEIEDVPVETLRKRVTRARQELLSMLSEQGRRSA